jgi:hypothetical protein
MYNLSVMMNEQKVASFYYKSILQSLNSVVITIDETGRVTTVDNAHLLGLDDLLSTMRLTSFEHWLGRSNSQLTQDIQQALMIGKKSVVPSYDFCLPGKPSYQIKYTVRRLSTEHQGAKKSIFLEERDARAGRRISQSRIIPSARASMSVEHSFPNSLAPSLGCLLVMEISQPNHRMLEQLSCQLSPDVVSYVEDLPQKTEGEFLEVAVLVIDVRRCNLNSYSFAINEESKPREVEPIVEQVL